MRWFYTLVITLMLLCIGCEWHLTSSDNESEGKVVVERYDRIQSLYLTTGDFSALQQMNTGYPQQTRTLIEDVLKIGKVNEPAFVRHTCEFLAARRGMAADDFAALTFANAERAFA